VSCYELILNIWTLQNALETTCILRRALANVVGLDSSVGVATRYGLDGPVFESRLAQNFSHPSRPALGSTQTSKRWIPGHSRG
jgi:hypothetical protein